MIEFQENITILSRCILVSFKKYLRKSNKASKEKTQAHSKRRKDVHLVVLPIHLQFWLDGLLVHFVYKVNNWIDPEHYFILDGLVAVLLFWRNTWNGNGLNIWGRMGLIIAAWRNFVVFAMCSFERGNRKAHGASK